MAIGRIYLQLTIIMAVLIQLSSPYCNYGARNVSERVAVG